MKRMMHINLAAGDTAPLVLLPGSPERAVKIASHFDDCEEKAYHREFRTFTGTLCGKPISVCSTGIGGPSMAIAVEELVQVGSSSFLRVGTCLSVSEDVGRGDLVLAQGAVRMEGVAEQYLPPEFPAVSDPLLLMKAEEALQGKVHIGNCITRSSYYTPFDGFSRPSGKRLKERWDEYVGGGAIVSDTDTAILYIVASSLGVRASSLLVATNPCNAKLPDIEDDPEDCEDILIAAALESAKRILDGKES